LVLVGEGALRARCQALLEQAGVADRAWLPGERSDVPALMRGLHLYVLPSRAEGISNTILEAMASGLPVVATQVGGSAELVEHGHTGYLVPPGHPPALTEAILQLIESPDVTRGLGLAGRERTLRLFSLNGMVQAYDSLYRGLLQQPLTH
jgi:glycosyltransferase involved in cell wall biosynthesis